MRIITSVKKRRCLYTLSLAIAFVTEMHAALNLSLISLVAVTGYGVEELWQDWEDTPVWTVVLNFFCYLVLLVSGMSTLYGLLFDRHRAFGFGVHGYVLYLALSLITIVSAVVDGSYEEVDLVYYMMLVFSILIFSQYHDELKYSPRRRKKSGESFVGMPL